MFGMPHRNKRRLTKKERDEVEEWERATKDMFECGHRDGVVLELWPGDIIHLGNLLGSIFGFEVFARVGDWRYYEDELLLIGPDEAALWLREIDEVHRALQGAGNLPREELEKLARELFREDLASRLDLEQRLDAVQERAPFAQVTPLKRNLMEMERPDAESSRRKMAMALADAAGLCRASLETGNPIRLLW